jgi:hypothetical protein
VTEGCVWTALSNASWIHAAASGNGNGEVAYSVDANPLALRAHGTITIAGRTFSVNQQGSAACTYAVSPTQANFSSVRAERNRDRHDRARLHWSAVSNDPWISDQQRRDGSGNGVVTYSIPTLWGQTTQRSGSLTVAGKTVTVTQSR